ncbi:MAG TPA: molybdopterin-binding protein [Croceibacterium sp.]|nr:molybdopterin-binding protein [Croceibacterium sp.]
MKRRNVLAGLAAAFTAGCAKVGESETFSALVDGAERLHRGAHRLLGGRPAMAREYSPADISPYFRGNGNTDIETDFYRAHQASNFAEWRLEVRGLVDRPLSLAMDQIRALPQRTQITRHDCVEGWSAIGQWTGPQLSTILDAAGLQEEARFIVFRCADDFRGVPYYESCDLDDAFHPQTLIAHELNGEPLPVRNGAPLRLRIERHLGYKHAKYLMGIEAVASLDQIGDGQGGYWEDRGYQWYAGI